MSVTDLKFKILTRAIHKLVAFTMSDFADRATDAGMIHLSETAREAAMQTIRDGLRGILSDPEIREQVQGGDDISANLAYEAMLESALAAAQSAEAQQGVN